MNHPEHCYVLIIKRLENGEAQGELGLVKWGEHGYYKTNYPDNYTEELVNELNAKMDITPAQADAMKMCSMIDTVGEDLEKWETHYNKCLALYEEHKKECKKDV